MNELRNPFDRYENGGRVLLGIPAGRDGSARHGYGPQVFAQCGFLCAYCGYDMASPYEAWLNLSVDHVVPQHLVRAGWKTDWLLDLVNLVTCCRACNEFLNGYRVADTKPPGSLDGFLRVRDSVYDAKLQHAQQRHAKERVRYAAARPAGPIEAQEDLARRPMPNVVTGDTGIARRTQRVTASDIAHGQIRVPHETKELFPDTRTNIDVDILGHQIESRWDPRFGPDQERSGVIRIGRRLMEESLTPNEVLEVRRTARGVSIGRPAR
jgi:hypothetical protein